MELKRLDDYIQYSDEKMAKNPVFDSEHMFYDVYCLLPGQAQKAHAHEGSDKVYYVLEGRGTIQVGIETRTIDKGEAALAPAGHEHGIRNESEDGLVLLVVMAPKP